MSEIMKCPKCGGELDKGFVVAKLVAWSDKKIGFWSLSGIFGGEQLINRGYPYPIDNVEGYRCTKCKLVIFEYAKNEDKKQ